MLLLQRWTDASKCLKDGEPKGTMEPKDLRVVIMSRKRVESCKHVFSLVPYAYVTVAEDEKNDYSFVPPDQLILHANNLEGIGPIRAWILERFSERAVVIMGDDIKSVSSLVGKRSRKIKDPEAILQILLNAAEIAEGIGCTCFSFAITANLLDFEAQEPFGFVKANGPCLGFVGRNVLPDARLKHYTDVDITLAALLKDRVVWQDRRFAFDHSFQSNLGGGTHLHSTADSEWYLKYLTQKWGSPGKDRIWDVQKSGGKTRTIARVRRRQKLEL
jgi:hypothetical protein